MTIGTPASPQRTVLRDGSADPERVTYVELFFDLVFAFAIAQIAGVLTDEPTFFTIAQAVVITLAVWWVWVYTTWATNWLNPDARPVLWLLLALSATGLVISETIPSAFEGRRYVFVGAYLIYAALRTLGVIAAVRRTAPAIAGGQYRILGWTAVAGVLWVGGCLVPEPPLRLTLWAAAIILEYLGPVTLFWVPGLGQSSWSAWRIRGGHFSERAALFIIIVLGESILVIGTALASHELTLAVVAASLLAFGGAIVMWFLYFAHGQDRGHEFISQRAQTGPVARLSYTYLHVLLVIGLVATTHGAHLSLEKPLAVPDLPVTALVYLGPAVYLLGLFAFKRSIGIPPSWIPSHLAGVVALALLFALAAARVLDGPLLLQCGVAAAVLVLVVTGDEILWKRRALHAIPAQVNEHGAAQ